MKQSTRAHVQTCVCVIVYVYVHAYVYAMHVQVLSMIVNGHVCIFKCVHVQFYV